MPALYDLKVLAQEIRRASISPDHQAWANRIDQAVNTLHAEADIRERIRLNNERDEPFARG